MAAQSYAQWFDRLRPALRMQERKGLVYAPGTLREAALKAVTMQTEGRPVLPSDIVAVFDANLMAKQQEWRIGPVAVEFSYG